MSDYPGPVGQEGGQEAVPPPSPAPPPQPYPSSAPTQVNPEINPPPWQGQPNAPGAGLPQAPPVPADYGYGQYAGQPVPANDPLYEVAMTFGGHRKEDKFWAATLTALGERLGIENPVVDTKSTCVDSKRQWRHASNIWHNSMIRSVLQTITAPVIGLAHMVRRDKGTAET